MYAVAGIHAFAGVYGVTRVPADASFHAVVVVPAVAGVPVVAGMPPVAGVPELPTVPAVTSFLGLHNQINDRITEKYSGSVRHRHRYLNCVPDVLRRLSVMGVSPISLITEHSVIPSLPSYAFF